jgi:hypothetical protein
VYNELADREMLNKVLDQGLEAQKIFCNIFYGNTFGPITVYVSDAPSTGGCAQSTNM